MKLFRGRASSGRHVRVPKELEPFALYLLNAGYKETTVASVIDKLKTILMQGLTEEDLEHMNSHTRGKYRYALRKYEEWLARELSEHKNKWIREFLKEAKEE